MMFDHREKNGLLEALEDRLEHHYYGVCETFPGSFKVEEAANDTSATAQNHQKRHSLSFSGTESKVQRLLRLQPRSS